MLVDGLVAPIPRYPVHASLPRSSTVDNHRMLGGGGGLLLSLLAGASLLRPQPPRVVPVAI